MQITIYSTTTCPYCKMLKDYLNEKGICFTEKLIDMDTAAKEELIKLSGGFQGVPFTTIALDGGQSENIVGFDKGKINSLLGIY